MRKILVLTQYKAMSLDRHINVGWKRLMSRELGEFIDVVPPQQRIDEHWYQGTADAVYQNIYTLEKERPELRADSGRRSYLQDELSHAGRIIKQNEADLTIGALRVTVDEARQFGVMQIDENSRVAGFEEKKPNPKTIPGDPRHCLASMGIYVFNARFLFEQLCLDATRPGSAHDFGHNIIPSIIDTHRVFAFPFRDENRKEDSYWRDVGTLEAYHAANMDLVAVDPLLNMYDHHWPIRTYQMNLPPPKFVFAGQGPDARRGEAMDSIVCQGCILSGGQVERSILGPKCGSTASRGSRIRSCSRESTSAGTPRCGGPSSTKACTFLPARKSATTRTRTGPAASRSAKAGITVIAKADGVEHFQEELESIEG